MVFHNDFLLKCTVEEFLLLPSLTNLNGLGPDKRQLLVEYLEVIFLIVYTCGVLQHTLNCHFKQIAVTNTDKVSVFDVYSELVMKLCAAVSLKSDSNALETVQQCVDDVLQSAFHKASGDKLVELNNSLLVHMGLIKVIDYLLLCSLMLVYYFFLFVMEEFHDNRCIMYVT